MNGIILLWSNFTVANHLIFFVYGSNHFFLLYVSCVFHCIIHFQKPLMLLVHMIISSSFKICVTCICIFFLFYSLPYKIICLMHNQIYKAYFVCLLVSLSFYKTIFVWIMEQFNYWIMFEVNSIHVCGQDHFFNYKCHTTPCTDNICMFLYYALYVGFTG